MASELIAFVFTGESIKTANEQISECKKELEEAKTIRKNRQGTVHVLILPYEAVYMEAGLAW